MPLSALLNLLAFANFVIGMGGFVAIGVLSPIATALDVSRSAAGWTMTAYALVYGLASPVLVALTGKWDRKLVLTGGLAVFTVGSALVALAPNFGTLFAARGIMALGAGVVTPVAAAMAASLAPPEKRGGALATVFAGLTLAQVVGVPIGAWIGYAFGWRAAFLAVTVLSLVGALVLAKAAPRGVAASPTSFASLGSTLASPRLMGAIAFTALFIGALYVLYTFLGPFLEARHGLKGSGVTLVLALYGLGAVAGNMFGGRLADRIGAKATLVILCLAQMALLPFLTMVEGPLALTVATLAIWSLFGWAMMAPQQSRLAALDPPRTPVLFALNASAIYLGGSIGSYLGGRVLDAQGFWALGPTGAAMMAAALLIVLTVGPGKAR